MNYGALAKIVKGKFRTRAKRIIAKILIIHTVRHNIIFLISGKEICVFSLYLSLQWARLINMKLV
jgi:hypothetical protein